MIPGARVIGTLHEIHPYDLSDWLDGDGRQEFIEIVHVGGMMPARNLSDLIKIGDDYYFQDVSRPAVTKRIS